MINQKKRTILMVALDFPPCQSAGVQRTLKFAEYLADLGWQVVVLTVDEKVYNVTDKQLTVTDNITVYRCHSFDSLEIFLLRVSILLGVKSLIVGGHGQSKRYL